MVLRTDEPRARVFVGSPEEAETIKALLARNGVPSATGPAGASETGAESAAVIVRSSDVSRALEIGEKPEWEHTLLRPAETESDDGASPAEELDDELPRPARTSGEPTEDEIQWYFAIARFLLWVLAAVVALVLVSRALT